MSIGTSKTVIGYVRVSTDKQAKHGWSFEAQKDAIQRYCAVTGSKLTTIFTETESGKRNDRPVLDKTIRKARSMHGLVAVAVLDRLGRNSYFINKLLETGIDFVDCQSPNDTPFITRIKAAVAQEEREKISRRTKDGLAAAKNGGKLLGSSRPGAWDGTCRCPKCSGDTGCQTCNGTGQIAKALARKLGAMEGAKIAAAANRRLAREFYEDVVPDLKRMKAQGMSLAEIAAALNEQGHVSRRGKPWNRMQVKLVLDRERSAT